MKKKISIEECVVTAMDGSDKELFPFLPYILQDLFEFGANPDTVIRLISKQFEKYDDLKVLDLGCGKGAVSVKASRELGCTCHGIDAIPEFVEIARQQALEFKVNHLCKFEKGDIREKVKELPAYDVVILGAIGPVFGDYFSTLSSLVPCVNDHGVFIIDDGYINDDSDFSHPFMLKYSEILQQIEKAGMQLVENETMGMEEVKKSGDHIFNSLKKRCHELMELFPDRQNLFAGYIRNQETENDVLENKVTATTLVIKKK